MAWVSQAVISETKITKPKETTMLIIMAAGVMPVNMATTRFTRPAISRPIRAMPAMAPMPERSRLEV